MHAADFALLRDGGLALFWSPQVLTEVENELHSLGYDAARLEAAQWDGTSMHGHIAAALDFPDYYGQNLNALADCLGDVAHGDYGWDCHRTGLVVTVEGFAAFHRRDPDLAQALADSLAAASARALLFGHRILWLLHADDPKFRLASVGAFSVPWNGREWLASKRG